MQKLEIIQEAISPSQIQNCFQVMKELRPYLEEDTFVERITRMHSFGYKLIYIANDQGQPVAAAGFRFTELLHWGRAIYIDDLSTLESERSKGYASQLLDHIHKLAKQNDCAQVHLDSGCKPERYNAHRLYLNKGYNITSHHFALMVK
ncbi:MAG TPA: GNAT family N-acetyltransferase [Bacteroidia bacterium]|nr:GNAT family N-acetyltransferase [Bacteroidia bacterium]HNS13499.1 GNAT family N-acetyltransferase [Bacteroidia bacterium]